MFSSVIVGSNAMRLQWMQEVSLESKKLLLVRTYGRYLTAEDAARQFRTLAPTLVLLDLDDRAYALEMATGIHAACPETAIIALSPDTKEHFDVSETGIVSVVPFEVEAWELEKAVAEAVHQVKHVVNPQLISFLPAKAGSGCSFVVMNTAFALSRTYGKNVLVLEGDLRSGVLSSALSCRRTGSIQQALLASHELDAFRWNRVVTQHAGVDWLLSDRTMPKTPPDWSHYFATMQFAMPRYDCVLVDLPELVNPGTAEIVRSSGRVYVVTTQEMITLTLAQQRFGELASWGIPVDRIGVLVNRFENRTPARADVERLLQHPVAAAFPNDYAACQKAISDGLPVGDETPLGAAYSQFAAGLIGTAAMLPRPRRLLSKLFEGFSVG